MGLRIAYVINSLEGGGAAQPVPAIIGLLCDRGATVRVLALSMRNGKARPALVAAGIDHRVGPGRKDQHARAFRWLIRELRGFQPDLIWTSLTQATVMGQIAGRLLSVPVVSWQHNAFLKPANLRLLRMTRSWSRLWVADSANVAALTRQRLGLDTDRVMTWPLFIAQPKTTAAPIPPHSTFRIGSLGRLHPNKGYDILIAALDRARASLPRDTEIAIAGEGQQHEQLEAQRRAAGIEAVKFIGYANDSDAFLESCDAYVQPSRAEGFCIAAHEAMAAGLPCIVSDVGEMPETVRAARGGWIVPPGDVEALAAALVELTTNRRRAALMGAAARSYVADRYGPAAFADAGNAIYDRIGSRFGRSA